MRCPLPATFVGRTDRDDIREDVDAAKGITLEERARILEALCRLAAEQAAQHANPQRVFDWQDPLSPESAALLAALRERFRHRG
jgi:hypothetical protein